MPRVGKNKQELARGTRRERDSLVLVPCRFDEDTFATIRKYSKEHNQSFATSVRCLVEWGLMQLGYE